MSDDDAQKCPLREDHAPRHVGGPVRANRGVQTFDFFRPSIDPRPFVVASRRSTKHEPVVYYMRMDRLVKIGWTRNLALRVAAVGPQGVLAVEPGAEPVESRRHMQFIELRSHREWFWLREPLTDHIAALRDQLQAREGVMTEQWLEQHGIYAPPTYNPEPSA